MENLSLEIKKFLQNKNTVTVVGVILAIFVLYFAYTMRVKSAINPITVPYASQQISGGTRIKESMIASAQVPPSMLKGEVILNRAEIVNKYVDTDTMIPKGSLFYRRAVVEKEQLEEKKIKPPPNGYDAYFRATNVYETYGNSILEGNYVDIWVTSTPDLKDKTKIRVSKFLSNVRVLSVSDATGYSVFQNLDEKRQPAMIRLAIPEQYAKLMDVLERLTIYNVSIKMVPTNESLKDNPGETTLSSESLKKWIEANEFLADEKEKEE